MAKNKVNIAVLRLVLISRKVRVFFPFLINCYDQSIWHVCFQYWLLNFMSYLKIVSLIYVMVSEINILTKLR